MQKLPLRYRLSLIYSLIAVVTFILSGLYIYNNMYSLSKKAAFKDFNTMNAKIESIAEKYKISRFQQDDELVLLRPQAYSKPNKTNDVRKFAKIPKEEFDIIFKDVTFTKKDYYVMVYDEESEVIWRSDNLHNCNLPMMPTQKMIEKLTAEKLKKYLPSGKLKKFVYKKTLSGVDNEKLLLNNQCYNGQNVVYYFQRNKDMIVTIAATEKYFSFPLRDYQRTLNFAIPVFWLATLLIGLFFIKYAFTPMDKITKAANMISATNLHERLPAWKTRDELGRLTETINEMINRLEISFSEVQRFTGDVSHELKTPLTILRGELELALNARQTQTEYTLTIASALDEVIRLQNVVESLLELSRADLGKAKINLVEKSLTKLVVDIVEDAIILAEEHNLSVQSKVQSDITLIFDPVRMHQCIINVIDNAIKYNNEHGTIFINLYKEGEHAVVLIRDTGIGIPAEDLPHIFDRFYRVDQSRSKQGSGLGLSIVKWIVEAHKGTMKIVSISGKGTEFKLMFPISHPELIEEHFIQKQREINKDKNKRYRIQNI
ncbi:MAG: HAMP domain-containing sensor histidine kinase [bacterium]